MNRPLALPLLAALFVSVPGCAREGSEPSDAAADSAAADSAIVLDSLAVHDSVPDWVRDIREGILPLPAAVEVDANAARERAVELYVTRQERIEQTVGAGTGSDSLLAASVLAAESRFHVLMQLLGGATPPDSASVAKAVADLDTELGRVLALVEGDSGTPPADTVPGAPGESR